MSGNTAPKRMRRASLRFIAKCCEILVVDTSWHKRSIHRAPRKVKLCTIAAGPPRP